MVSLALAVLALEGTLRLFGFSPRATMNRFDSRLGWTKAPSASIRRRTAELDVRLETNSRGLREDESVDYAKPAGTTRILLVGDSFTLGYTVNRPDTLSQLLQARLRAEGRDAQVLNGGTEGYSTDQETLWLAFEGARYAPDVVILQMYENDVFWNGEERYLRYPKPRLSFERAAGAGLDDLPPLADPGSDPWVVRRTALGGMLAGLLAGPAVPMLPGPRPIPAEWGVLLRDDASGWPETRAALRVFHDVAGEIGARPLALVIPAKAQIDARSRAGTAEAIGDPAYDPDRPYRGMIAAARGAGLAVVDPEAAMAAALPGGALYFVGDWHTTARGNRVLVDELAAALSGPTFLGPPPHAVPAGTPAAVPERGGQAAGRTARSLAIVVGVWLALATLYRRRFPGEGVARTYGAVGLLVGLVALVIVGFGWLIALLPLRLARWVSPSVAIAVLAAVLWYSRRRLPVMGELLAAFVRRGQWYLLPVVVGLLSLGALLVVAATSPWLAPFIYTLF